MPTVNDILGLNSAMWREYQNAATPWPDNWPDRLPLIRKRRECSEEDKRLMLAAKPSGWQAAVRRIQARINSDDTLLRRHQN